MEGYLPENPVDHINRNRSDNKWNNLREVSHSCNSRNMDKPKTNTSGVVGVYLSGNKKSYCSYITINQKTVHLGTSKTFEEAVKARWEAEKKYEFLNCNTTSTAYNWLREHDVL